MSGLDAIYRRLPVWAQHGAVSLYGAYWHRLRFGPGFQRHLAGYLERERWTGEQWREWTSGALKELLGAAARAVPHYRDTWSPSEKAAAAAGDLASLPLLSKEPLRADARRFLRDDASRHRTFVFHTSGSTGTPIESHWTVSEIRNSLALREARSARWAGVSFRMPRATFSGRLAEPDPASRGPFHRFNLVERQVYFSPFHLRAETAPQYLDALRRHRTQWMTGYAVSSYLLARFTDELGLAAPRLKAVVTTSEKVTPAMREVMERVYGCRVFEEYSTVENVLFASECERGRLHVSPDAGVVEILRDDGTPCEPGEPGEVVATCLMRDYQPLVRFRLGDVAAWDPEPCPCGRAMPVIREVVGRIEDVVVGPDGRQMVRFHGVFVDQPHIREAQVVQETVGRLRIKVVPAQGFGPADVADVVHRVRQRLGPDVEVVVETVEAIPRSKAGKFQAVVSLLRPPVRAPGEAPTRG
jgi:phenylacetate-CoA ligase